MKNNKHTPGPWEAFNYDPKSPGFKNGKAWGVVSDDGTPAFTVYKSEKFDCRSGVVKHYWDPKAKAKDAANARLIAAAPDLLAALVYCEIVLNATYSLKAGNIANAIDKAHAAIAKAKGDK